MEQVVVMENLFFEVTFYILKVNIAKGLNFAIEL